MTVFIKINSLVVNFFLNNIAIKIPKKLPIAYTINQLYIHEQLIINFDFKLFIYVLSTPS